MILATLQQTMNGETMGKHRNPALFSGLPGKQRIYAKSLQLRKVPGLSQENTGPSGKGGLHVGENIWGRSAGCTRSPRVNVNPVGVR